MAVHSNFWSSRTQPPELRPGELHVWRVRTSAAIVPSTLAVLSADERLRAATARCDAARRRFVNGRAALRNLLGGYTMAPPQSLDIVAGPHGKPAVHEMPDLQFNLSHSGTWVMIAFARTVAVGVDLERFRPIPDWARVSDRFLGLAQRQKIEALPEHDRQRRFVECWVRKEAYFKMVGSGLAEDSRTVDLIPEDATGLTYFAPPLARDYAAAVIAHQSSLTLRFMTLVTHFRRWDLNPHTVW